MPAISQPTKDRLPWFAPLLVAILLAAVGWWAHRVVRRALEEKLAHELQTVLNANVTALDIWMRNQKRIASGIAEDPEIRSAALALLSATNAPALVPRGEPSPSPQPPPGPGPGLGPGATAFDRAVSRRTQTAGFFLAQLVSTNLVVKSGAGRGRGRAGMSVPTEHQPKFSELFASGEPVIITPFKPRPGPGRGRDGRPPGRFRFSDRPPGAGETSSPPPGLDVGGPPAMGSTPRPDFARDAEGPNTNVVRRGPGSPPAGGLMQVAAPIRDDDGVVRGAVAFILNPDLEFSRILSVARQGLSGETYAFDAEGLLLSQSRFDEQLKSLGLLSAEPGVSSPLTLVLRDPGGDLTSGFRPTLDPAERGLTRMVSDAVEGGSGVSTSPSRDYRGVPVIGAWQWLAGHHFGVVTQLDAVEAYQPLGVLRTVFLTLLGLLAVAAGLALVITHFNLRWRHAATEAAQQLRQLGQYTLEDKIGEGAMGVVYRARHALLRRETAVKLLLPGKTDERTLHQFEQEVRLTCGLTHPNTIQIYDFGHTPDGVFYYAMEYLQGLNLAELVDQHGPPSEDRILHILTQVCDSLAEAHAAGLVHRDIKPANIFLCERGGLWDTVKVLDFGLVKPFSLGTATPPSPTLAVPQLSGTPNYLPPETIRDPGHSDPRSDLYAVGAVAYFLATGGPVFDGENIHDILQAHLTRRPTPPRQCQASISQDLETIILQCLEKAPEDRPASAADLRRRLEGCPRQGTWTAEHRRAWWTARARQADAGLRPPTPPETVGIPEVAIDATLRISLADRTQ